MPESLFIVLSTLLADYFKLAEDGTGNLAIPEARLIVVRDPAEKDPDAASSFDPWELEVKQRIIESIRSCDEWKRSSIRVAGHLRTCFGASANLEWEKDQRFPEKEIGLQDELGHEIDIQIWGFHHKKEWSEIWKSARRIEPYLKDSRDEVKALFFVDLAEAFQRSTRGVEQLLGRTAEQKLWERLSVFRHDIIGLFDPLRMRLETARDISKIEPSRAGEIRSSVKGVIESRLKTARHKLNECSAQITVKAASELFRMIEAKLDATPDLDGFSTWLHELDDYLNNLRNAVSK